MDLNGRGLLYTFALIFYLTQACLGEVTLNFRRIYISIKKKNIHIYFFLENFNEEDIENEILFYFRNYIDDQEALGSYKVTHEIVFGKDGYIKSEDGDLTQIFHRKEGL